MENPTNKSVTCPKAKLLDPVRKAIRMMHFIKSIILVYYYSMPVTTQVQGSAVPGSRLKSTENGLHLQIRCGVPVETLPVEDLRIIMALKRR
jgi:hypothetical protein